MPTGWPTLSSKVYVTHHLEKVILSWENRVKIRLILITKSSVRRCLNCENTSLGSLWKE